MKHFEKPLITTISKNLFVLIFLVAGGFLIEANAQYEKNPQPVIQDDGYTVVVEKYVQIPNFEGNPPRINCFTFMGDRNFVATETGGRIYEILDNGDGSYSVELFFDVRTAIPAATGRELTAEGSWHAGLRSVAFHPEFETNGKFYISHMEERPADTTGHNYLSDVAEPTETDGTVAEWTYDFTEEAVDASSYREVLRVGVPFFDHTIKQITFNPHAEPGDEDYGLLYIAHGDGNPYYDPSTGGQENDGRGKIIRINPLEDGAEPYSVPSTNPFVGDENWLDELYTTGMRNPHNMCFAKDASGEVHFIVANVGRENIDEVCVVRPGENHGWSEREGTYVQLAIGGLHSGIEALPDNEAELGYTYPAAQWTQADPVFNGVGGLSVAGGYIYHLEETGERLYISGDFPESGIMMYNELDELVNAVTNLDPEDESRDEPSELTQAPFKLLHVYFDHDNNPSTPPQQKNWMKDVINDDSNYDDSNRSDLRFGRDAANNIYITNKRNGWVYKIQSVSASAPDAIDDVDKSVADITIYPNPTDAQSTVRADFGAPLPENAELILLTTDGRVVETYTVSQGTVKYELNLNTAQISAGMYILQLNSSSGNRVESLIIQ